MKRIEKRIAASSLGTKKATAARATVSKTRSGQVLARATQIRAEKSSPKRDTK